MVSELMAVTLIVLAHPERKSFNGAWADATERASVALGHEVIWSDLCSMRFDPVEARQHFSGDEPNTVFDPLKAQERAVAAGTLPDDVATEIAKIQRADRIICHFPIWWFGAPAVLKGWMDRVLAHGALHSVDQRFDRGMCRGKKVLFCVTLGATEAEASFNGKEGDIQMLLWPLAYTMRYLGMTVLEPNPVFSVHGYFEGEEEIALRARLAEVLEAQSHIIANFDTLPEMRFNADTDFDETGRLKPDAPSYTPFIRHKP